MNDTVNEKKNFAMAVSAVAPLLGMVCLLLLILGVLSDRVYSEDYRLCMAVVLAITGLAYGVRTWRKVDKFAPFATIFWFVQALSLWLSTVRW